MALKEKWMPSPHYSSSRGAYLKAALHTTEGAQTIESLGSWFQQPAAKCSSHHGADNAKRGLFGAYVYENHNAWTQGNMNSVCLSIELCTPSGAASNWSRNTWLGAQETLTRNAAEWVAYVCGKYKIPIVALSASQAQDSTTKGVCQHVNFGSKGSGHHDCGPGFPMDKVIEWAKGGSSSTPAPTPEDTEMTPSVAFDSQGRMHFACIWTDGKVNYRPPNGTWYAVDHGSNALKGGCDIAINPANDYIVITYINQSNAVCTYEKSATASTWSWASRGGSAK
jgi:hypothetical protein